MGGRCVRKLLVLSVALALGACGETSETSTVEQPIDVPDNLQVPGGAKQVDTYIIVLDEDPAAAYDGTTQGYAATAPAAGAKYDPTSSAAKKYKKYLEGKQDAVLASVGALKEKLYNYTNALNGVSASLSPAQAAQVGTMSGVKYVVKDQLVPLTTDTSPTFLGINAPGGMWDLAGGPTSAGENVIIGVIDTGIWPEHPSFSDQEDLADRPGESGKDTRVYGPPPAYWRGTCQAGEQWSKDDCNNKLIGARYYLLSAYYHGHSGRQELPASEYLSPRDADGHGTHTASTAGGNYGADAVVLGNGLGTVSGMAPRARIAMYKACWTFKDGSAGCYNVDTLAAIDQAVADGVDVINYSIGGGAPSLNTANDLAFLYAEDVGVFIATSAGNDGPGPSTIYGPANTPWVTSVGASTHNRTFQGSATLGDGATYVGASITAGTAVLPLVDSADAGSELCIPGELSSAVQGKIVLCKRGDIARVEKSLAVAMAGGAGMILYNEKPTESLVTDLHYVPAVHISLADGLEVKAYLASAGTNAQAQITAGAAAPTAGKVMASFSSRGPNGATWDLIKPDVTAPGVNILAGFTPTPELGSSGQLFTPMSGTSMSSPHVAGIAAALRHLHPDWTPAMIKSALMTTGGQDAFKDDGVTPADPFDIGGGHITPNSAADPGLVYEAGYYDYLAFLCRTSNALSAGSCAVLESWGFSLDPSDLNYASIAVGSLPGMKTVTRKVTNVGATATYVAKVDAPPGITVSVNPSVLTIPAGATAKFTVTFTRTPAAPLFKWAFGAVTWQDGVHNVRSPIAVRPVRLSAPDEKFATTTAGSMSWDVTFGYDGVFNVQPWGLIPATRTSGSVVDDPANDINTALATDVGVTYHLVYVPSGTRHARFSLFDPDTDGEDDLDLYLFGPHTAGFPHVGSSGSPTSAEEVNAANPAPGYYFVVVHGWQTDGPYANYALSSWLLSEAAEGNLSISGPTSATLGGSGTVQADWSGLADGKRYLGAAGYYDASGAFQKTLIAIDTN
jgi:subtilisin family serine protease